MISATRHDMTLPEASAPYMGNIGSRVVNAVTLIPQLGARKRALNTM
jgi:hypothetical protein